MDKYIGEILVNENELKNICKRLGAEITKDYQGKNLMIVGILKGAFVFMADLLREIKTDCEVDFIMVDSYDGTARREGKINVVKDLDISLENYHVLVIEDILESGYTLKFVSELLNDKKPLSIKTCVLLDKPTLRKVEIEADYVGKIIPNDFVVGYGLDYNQNLRNIPYIGILKKEYYS